MEVSSEVSSEVSNEVSSEVSSEVTFAKQVICSFFLGSPESASLIMYYFDLVHMPL